MKVGLTAPIVLALIFMTAGQGCYSAEKSKHPEANVPVMDAEFPLKPDEEVKVLVLTSCGAPYNEEIKGMDCLLAAEFMPLLQRRCDENNEKVCVLKSAPIDAFKKENPDWREMHPMEIGKRFSAHYVIDIEVLEISLFERRSNQELTRGRATLCMKVYDSSKGDRDPVFRPSDYIFEFPTINPAERGEAALTVFRQAVLKKMANDLVRTFCSSSVLQDRTFEELVKEVEAAKAVKLPRPQP